MCVKVKSLDDLGPMSVIAVTFAQCQPTFRVAHEVIKGS